MARLSTKSAESGNGRVTERVQLRRGGRRSWQGVLRVALWRLGVSLVIMLAIAEVGLRAVDLGHPYESEPDSYLRDPDPNVLFVPKPGFRGYSEGTEVAISSQGLRDREYELAHPPNTTRVVILGDSVTFGPGVLTEETFSKQLEHRLNALGDGWRYEVINTGVIGYNTIQERARLERVGLRFQPDVVVLTFVVNDLLDTFSIFDHQYEPGDALAPLKKWLRRNSRLYRFYQNVSWRLQGELRRDPNQPEPPRDRQRVLEREAEIGRIAQISRDSGAKFLLVLYPDNLANLVSPDASGEQVTVRDELLSFAARSGFPTLDLTEALGDVRDPRARVMRLREDPHPSPTGHRAIADALLSSLLGAGLLR